MHTKIAALGTVAILASLVSALPAQSQQSGSAALEGLQERSVRQGSPSRTPADSLSTSTINTSDNSGLAVQLDKNVQLRVRPETDEGPVGVFPNDDTAKGNKVQLIYQFDNPPAQQSY